MSPSERAVVQVCADRGVAPGGTKGAAQHLRGTAAGMTAAGVRVETYAARKAVGPFPVPVRDLSELDRCGAVGIHAIYERYSLGHDGGLELARRLGVPFVLEVNAPLVDEATAHRPDSVGTHDSDVERRLLAEADLVITVSSPLADWVAGHRWGPSLVVPNGFEPAWFVNPAQQSEAPLDHSLVFLGHPKPWHGADRIVALLTGLRARGFAPGCLLVGGGPGAEAIEDLAHRAGVGDQLTVTGALPPDAASALLATAAIGLAPYRRQDPFYFCPLKVVDYMAAGLAVVASDLGDCGALLGETGVLVDPDDGTALIDAVQALLVDRQKSRALGKAARDRAMSSMTWGHTARVTLAAMQELTTLRAVGTSGAHR